MTDIKDNKDKAEDHRERNKRMKREKIRKKCLSKSEKKARLETKEAGNDKNASSSTPTIAVFLSLSTPVGTSLNPLTPVATPPSSSTPASVTSSPASAISTSVSVYISPFSFPVQPSPFFFPARHTTLTFFSPMQVFRSTQLPLDHDYVI